MVVEDSCPAILASDHLATSAAADGLAELAIHYPEVPIVFAHTRKVAQEWTYRSRTAALTHLDAE